MKLQDVILKATAKKVTWLEAAEIIRVCDRTMRRMRERYQEFGYDGLFDQRHRKRTTFVQARRSSPMFITPSETRRSGKRHSCLFCMTSTAGCMTT